jgi:hypothetical protein
MLRASLLRKLPSNGFILHNIMDMKWVSKNIRTLFQNNLITGAQLSAKGMAISIWFNTAISLLILSVNGLIERNPHFAPMFVAFHSFWSTLTKTDLNGLFLHSHMTDQYFSNRTHQKSSGKTTEKRDQKQRAYGLYSPTRSSFLSLLQLCPLGLVYTCRVFGRHSDLGRVLT